MILFLPHPVHFLIGCCLKPSQVPLVWVLLDLCPQKWLHISSLLHFIWAIAKISQRDEDLQVDSKI